MIWLSCSFERKPLKLHWSHKYWSSAWYQISNEIPPVAADHCVSCLNLCPLPSSLSHGLKLLRIHKILMIKTMSSLFLFHTILALLNIVNDLLYHVCTVFLKNGSLLDSLNFYLQSFALIMKLFLTEPCFLSDHQLFKKIKIVCFLIIHSFTT